ncbi:hypothetical protein AB0J72_41275 [Dactylosporangium sp. NPDC049742]|uniref:hypothetical protein n=1 Tax=Dactylosporangium sp. NPDC049742 TaxID=3154737 RepID=UPI00342FAC06
MPELKRLDAGLAPAVLAFDLANRAYFAASVSDRGDDFFDQFTDRYDASLAEQEADPAHLGGKQGTWYQRDLVPEAAERLSALIARRVVAAVAAVAEGVTVYLEDGDRVV